MVSILCLLLHTLVCSCMPARWLDDIHTHTAIAESVTADDWMQIVASDLRHPAGHYIVQDGFPVHTTGYSLAAP
jgi:hypothetical protein